MGSPSINPRPAANHAALANADRVSGGNIPPATRPSALGAQRDIVHDRALYDMGVRGRLSDVAGGSAATYYGSIVPENPQQGQITETRFLQVLAEEFSRRLFGFGAGDGPDQEIVEVSRGMLEKFFAIIIPPGARMERVLRAAIGRPADLKEYVAVGEFVEELMKMLRPFIDNLEEITRLAKDLEGLDNARSADEQEAAAARLFNAAGVPTEEQQMQMMMGAMSGGPSGGPGILWFPTGGGPAKKYKFYEFTQKVGNQVHTLMQAHYWLTHPNDIIMFEDFIVAGPSLLATIWQAGTWAAPYRWIPELRAALMTAARPGQDTGSTKRPDIFNLSKRHLYEIKTVAQAEMGVAQVAGYYARLAPIMPDLHLAGFGFGDWKPFPVYYAGGMTVVIASMFAPGVITYQRIGSRVPVTNPLRHWAEEKKQYYQRQAARAQVGTAIAIVTVSFMGVMLLAAGVAVAAAAAGALAGSGLLAGGGVLAGGGAAATKWTLGGLAIGSGMAFAM